MSGIHHGQTEPLYPVEQIPLVAPASDSCADVYRAFEAYRKYIIHEDVLIGDRLQRLLTIQGLLFAAEATLLPKFGDLLPMLSDHPNELPTTHVRLFLYGSFALVIPFIGALSAHFVIPALKAAREALQELSSVWISQWGLEASRCKLPGLTGGGAADADKNGHKHILHIAQWFRGIWGAFFCVTSGSMLFFYLHVLHKYFR